MVPGSVLSSLHIYAVLAGAGDWPEPRHDAHLTSIQSTPGGMSSAPSELARFDLGRSRPTMVPVKNADGSATVGLCLFAGAVRCYEYTGKLRWESHPAGLNFTQIITAQDLDGDGRTEILLMAGRPADPYGAAVLLSLADGSVIWRYDVEPMSYQWYLYAGKYMPGTNASQIVVIMHAYPPDKDNGYMALFDFVRAGAAPVQKWRYNFPEYTCFPSFLQSDLDGDGVKELVVETHSRMWFLDAVTGKLKKFCQWDVSPGNVRSYGLVKFVDLNHDGLDDFLCIANFSQHHEVLLNRGGNMEEAWHHGWPESVTTGKVATVWPEPPYADIDGDGKLEIVISMFNSEGEGAWLLRVYDAITGNIKYRCPRALAVACADVDGDGAAEVLANLSDDPTKTVFKGARLLKVSNGQLVTAWQDDQARAIAGAPGQLRIEREGNALMLTRGEKGLELRPWVAPPALPGPDVSAIPAIVGPPNPMLLSADLLGDPANELILYQEPNVDVLGYGQRALKKLAHYQSSSPPVMADLDGDGKTELVLTTVNATSTPVIEATTPALENKRLWRTQFPPPKSPGLPAPRGAYVRTVHLTGKTTPDLYLWAGTPQVRSAGIDGRTGAILWETGELPQIERYCGPSVNFASTFDFNGDGQEDLVFTNPDYYCITSGNTGDLLFGPLSPQKIFTQPSQGLYTCPVILENKGGLPTVCLVDGHYFQGAMSIRGEPHWYRLPVTGENRAAREGFLRAADGSWRMGFGRQNGAFACVNVADGSVRWELPLAATASDSIACDVDGDGQQEFVFGTSHANLYAVGDVNAEPRVRWKLDLGAAVGNPIAADLDHDGAIELIACTADGYVHALGGFRAAPVIH